MTRRLPVVDSDDGTWGDWLNNFLIKEHYDTTGVPGVDNGGHKTITVRPGTTAAGTAPLKLTSGPLMTAAEAGAIEFLNDKLYFTQTTGTARKAIATFYDDGNGATGDVFYRDASGNFVKLGIGSPNQVLTTLGGIPAWSNSSAVGGGLTQQQVMAINSMRI